MPQPDGFACHVAGCLRHASFGEVVILANGVRADRMSCADHRMPTPGAEETPVALGPAPQGKLL